MTSNIVKDTENLGKERENPKNLVNFGRENGNFFRKKRHSEILVREKFLRPPPKLGARSPPLV